MPKKVTAGKTAGNKGGAASTPQGKVRLGKRLFRKPDPDEAIRSDNPKLKKVGTYAKLRKLIEADVLAGGTLKTVAGELGVTPARVYELSIMVGLVLRDLKRTAKARAKQTGKPAKAKLPNGHILEAVSEPARKPGALTAEVKAASRR
jgi:hypothetical protein